MSKDWIGNKKSTWATLAASNHSDCERETNDYYATDPKALEIFLDKLKEDNIELHNVIWECACGEGNLVEVLKNKGYRVVSSDLVNRGYSNIICDFLEYETHKKIAFDILTNPPYSRAKEFCEHALDILADDYYAIFFLKIQFLEGKARKKLFEKYPPKYIYINSERQKCAINNKFDKVKSSAVCYAWFIWQKGYKGESIVRWI